jgi:hypothetical protein
MNIDRELQFGPGMRVQRLTEAAFLVLAVFTQDLRFALVTVALTLLQVLSPRWALVALVVARFVRFRGDHRIGDLYFDLAGGRGACAVALAVETAALALILSGHAAVGFVLLCLPAASSIMAPTIGFCAGCWFYVLGRDWLARRGRLRRSSHDSGDISIDGAGSADQSQLPAAPQR